MAFFFATSPVITSRRRVILLPDITGLPSEVDIMVSQNAIPSRQHLGGSLPFVFTEHGVLQLANVLKSKRATQVSIRLLGIEMKYK